jgi:hypothetical protein
VAVGFELHDCRVIEPVDREQLVRGESLRRAADVAAEHSMVFAAVPPIADLDQRLDAQPELLDELAAQRRARLLAGFQASAREAPLADVLAPT